jgi:DNA-binding response OmpR family regulator
MTWILVVEDEASLRRILRLGLECAGYNVLEACDGLKGLALYHQTNIAVIITDLEMPEMDGVTMIRLLGNGQAYVPVIVISGNTQERLDSVKACGVQYILQKPFRLQELLDAVQALV